MGLCLHGLIGRMKNDFGNTDVFKYRQAVQQAEILKYKAQFFASYLRQPCFIQILQRRAVQQDFSGIMGDKTGDAVEQCGFAASRGPHDSHELAFFNGEVNVL